MMPTVQMLAAVAWPVVKVVSKLGVLNDLNGASWTPAQYRKHKVA
jgi:hypothetical protein